MLTVAKFPHACGAMLLDEPCCKATKSALIFFVFFISTSIVVFFVFGVLWLSMLKCKNDIQRSKAGSIRGTCHGMKGLRIFFF